MAHFIRPSDDGVYVNLDRVAKVVENVVDEESRFDLFDANGALIGYTSDDWDFDPRRATAPVVPARPGETGFIVFRPRCNGRPEMADVRVEEFAVAAWRVVVDWGAEPVFVGYAYLPELTFLRMPSGRLRCDLTGVEAADLDELRVVMLREFQGEWDREHLNSAHKTGRVAPDTGRVAMH